MISILSEPFLASKYPALTIWKVFDNSNASLPNPKSVPIKTFFVVFVAPFTSPSYKRYPSFTFPASAETLSVVFVIATLLLIMSGLNSVKSPVSRFLTIRPPFSITPT